MQFFVCLLLLLNFVTSSQLKPLDSFGLKPNEQPFMNGIQEEGNNELSSFDAKLNMLDDKVHRRFSNQVSIISFYYKCL
jgi:hypothetical protein